VVNAMRAACMTNRYIPDDGEHAFNATLASGRRRGLDDPRDLSHVGQNGYTLDNAPVQSVSLNSVFDLERGFWDSRDSLKTVYLGALSRMCAPWAVLGFCAARALSLVRPHCALPPIIGGPGSLNWFCAITAESGKGKSSAADVARELVTEYVRERNLGSGEGITDAYVKPANKETGEPRGLYESVMFVADEVDNMAALSNRSGSTMMPTLRSGFTGGKLGFSYRQASDLHLERHSYRMTLIANIQPGRAGALMDDIHGGTLQRFMWFPGIDPRVDPQIPTMPDALDLPPHSAWLYPRQIKVPYEAIELIRDERARNMRGETDTLDGHALFIREKFAFALAVLDGRDEMTYDDWYLAGTASRISDCTRGWMADQLDVAAKEEATKRGALIGVSQVAADEEKTRMVSVRQNKISRWVLSKLDEPMTTRELSRAITNSDRPYLVTVLERLEANDLIVPQTVKGSRGPGGKKWVKVGG
jgi:hypothetical protein